MVAMPCYVAYRNCRLEILLFDFDNMNHLLFGVSLWLKQKDRMSASMQLDYIIAG